MLNIPQKKSTALAVLLVLTFIIEGLSILILILVLSRTSGNIIRPMRNWQLAVMNIGMRKNGWMQQARTGRGL